MTGLPASVCPPHRKDHNPKSKKAPRCAQGAFLVRWFARPLEDDLRNELHVEGFTGPDAWDAKVVPGGIRHETESLARVAGGTGGCCPAAAAHGCRSLGKVDPVEEVKGLHSQLDFDALGNRDVLENREIHVCIAGTVQLIAREVADRACRRYRKRRRGPPLHPRSELASSSGVRISNQVKSQACLVGRIPGVEVPQPAELPAVAKPRGQSMSPRSLCHMRRLPR